LRRDELDFDELLILVMTEQFHVQDIYLVPRRDLDVVAPFDGSKRTLPWRRLEQFRVSEVPRILRPLMATSTLASDC
jgi:hypothetical protein